MSKYKNVGASFNYWDEIYAKLPFKVKFTNELDKERVLSSVISIGENMAEISETPKEMQKNLKITKTSHLIRISLKINRLSWTTMSEGKLFLR